MYSHQSKKSQFRQFDAEGGKGKMWQLFGEQMDEIINELNEALAA